MKKFRVGQRVRPSQEGIEAHVFDGVYRGELRAKWSGVVIAVDRFNNATVKWDALKRAIRYAPCFIAMDRRSAKRGVGDRNARPAALIRI